MPRSRKRLTVGLLMFLVAISAVAIWGFDYARRTPVVFKNDSPSRIRNVTVEVAGSIRYLGPVEPLSSLACRIAAPPGKAVHVSWDVQGADGQKDRHVMAPGMVASKGGSYLQVGWTGK